MRLDMYLVLFKGYLLGYVFLRSLYDKFIYNLNYGCGKKKDVIRKWKTGSLMLI